MNDRVEGSAVSASEHKDRDLDSETPGTPPMKTEDVEMIGSSMAVDKETERRLLKKLDVRIIPMVCWIYLMNFMDRVNIGNAKLYWLERDLGMSGNQYQLAVSLLFVTYVVSRIETHFVTITYRFLDLRDAVKHDHQENATCTIPCWSRFLLGSRGYFQCICQQLCSTCGLQTAAWCF
jgi:hypothetical protein